MDHKKHVSKSIKLHNGHIIIKIVNIINIFGLYIFLNTK